MSREIERDFVEESTSETKQCQFCDSFEIIDGVCICKEYQEEVPPAAYCDFFRSPD